MGNHRIATSVRYRRRTARAVEHESYPPVRLREGERAEDDAGRVRTGLELPIPLDDRGQLFAEIPELIADSSRR